jgi:RNA polymerase sigma-70 factor (ECF subfamily)
MSLRMRHLSAIQQDRKGENIVIPGIQRTAWRSQWEPPSTRTEHPMAFSLDRSILDKASRGESAALGAVVTALRPHIEKQLLRYPLSDEDRQDVMQSTLVQIIRRIGSFRGDSSFSTWLFRVTANEALMLMRSQRRHRARLVEGLDLEDLGRLPAANDAAEGDRADTNAVQSERDERVRRALAELPLEYRDVVSLHYHQDLGLQEIADRLGSTESAVRSRLHRARARLRTLLRDGEEAAAAAISGLGRLTGSASQTAAA